jgi:hypothetical protein
MAAYDFLTKTASQMNEYGVHGADTQYPAGIENGMVFLTDSGWEFVTIVPPFGANTEPVFLFRLPKKGRTGIIA